MELLNRVNKDFHDLLEQTDTVSQMKELSAAMLEKGMLMKGKPFPTFLKPYFVDLEDRKYFEYSTNMVVSSVNKVCEAYFKEGKFQEYIEFHGRLGELSKVDALYPGYQIIDRLDVFFNPENKELKYLEFNTADPSGMGWHDQLLAMFDRMPAVKALRDRYKLSADLLVKFHMRIFLRKYRQWCQAKGIKPADKPSMAFVCWNESTILSDYYAIIEYYREAGYDAQFADPREFDYDGHKLLLKGKHISLVYRDSMQDFLQDEFYPDCQNILNAYRDGNVCFINPVSSAAGGFKSVMEILTDAKYAHMFTPEENEANRMFVPWTRNFKDGATTYGDKKVDLVAHVRDNKDLFVLKPNAGYGGFGVKIGRYSDQNDWDQYIQKIISEDVQFTVQDFVHIPQDDFPVVENGEYKGFAKKNVNINFWSHDGEFAGCFVRAAAGSIINIHQGGGLVPVYFVSDK
ncbi:hypothetical protein JW905_14270 [bacterium]|nr:hypothetical protein [candidate division CSSED10-310 bacterium]